MNEYILQKRIELAGSLLRGGNGRDFLFNFPETAKNGVENAPCKPDFRKMPFGTQKN